jgi:predicted permease
MNDVDPPSRPRSVFFRLSLWLVERASSLVPLERRDEWRESWLGEIWHRALVLEREARIPPTQGLALVRRSLGAFSHAVFLASKDLRFRGIGRDFLHGLRSLGSRPGFTAVALLTLALGIGANTFLFTLAESVLLHPFPYADIDRLVAFESAFPKISADKEFIESMSMQDFRALEDETRTLTSFTAFDLGNRDLGGIGVPQRLLTAAFWGDAFETVGMTPALGRGFTREETERNEPVAILSHRVFQEHFGGDPSLVGKPILVNGTPRTLVGVMPPRLLIIDTDLWLPMWFDEDLPRSRRPLTVLARLEKGATLEQARAEVEVLARRIEKEGMKEAPEYEGWRLSVSSFLEVWSGFVGPAAWILMAASALALAIACGNIAGLLLARGAHRRNEMAIRAALGAPRSRLIAHLLSESVLLAVAGGALAILVARAAVDTTLAYVPSQLPRMGIEVEIDAVALGYNLVISLLSALLFGLLPAIQSARLGLPSSLAPEGRSLGSVASVRARRIFVSLQIAGSLILLAGAALMLKSLERLSAVDPGVRVENVLTMRVTLPWERYQGNMEPFYGEWLSAAERIPGVRAAGLATQFPPRVFMRDRLEIENRPQETEGDLSAAYQTIGSPGLFDALGMRLVRGRLFDERDTKATPPVVVVNQALVRRFFSEQDPLGRRIRTAGDEESSPWLTIVGVVSDARNRGLDREPAPELYAFYRQQGQWTNQMHLLLRTDSEPTAAIPAAREVLRSIDPDLPLYAVQTLSERFDTVVFTRRFASLAMAALALMSLLLAAMGLYGVVAFLVGERRRELGLRLALGADSRRLAGHVLAKALRLILPGILLGLAGAAALTRFLSGMLFQVEPHDPLSMALAVGVIVVACLLAALAPARRAARVDPVESLR